MDNTTHKGTELNNVKETWDQNERERQAGSGGDQQENPVEENAATTELDQLIKQEAAEYDNVNKEDRVLGGERATVNDDELADPTEA